MDEIQVTRTYLELRSPHELRRATTPKDVPAIRLVRHCPASLYRSLYASVGRRFGWVDRLGWTDEVIRRHLDGDGVHLWIAYAQGAPAGYFELQRHPDGSVEIAYLGLRPAFIGRGWGKALLIRAVDEAWGLGTDRVWLQTCTLDHPAALPNYLERGFRPFQEEVYTVPVTTV